MEPAGMITLQQVINWSHSFLQSLKSRLYHTKKILECTLLFHSLDKEIRKNQNRKNKKNKIEDSGVDLLGTDIVSRLDMEQRFRTQNFPSAS